MNDGSRWVTHRRYLYLLAKLTFFGLFIAGAWWLFGRLSSILVPIGLSFLLAYLLDPVVDWFEARGVGRTVSILLLMFLFLASVTIFVLVITPTLIDEVQLLASKFPNLVREIRDHYFELQGYLKKRFDYTLPETLSETFANYGQKIEELASDLIQRLTTFTGSVLSGTFAVLSYLLNVLLVPLFVFYYLRDFDRIKDEFKELIPLPMRDRVLARLGRVDAVVGHWFRGQVTVASILGVLYSVGLVALDVKLGIAIGLLSGVLSIIPYLGFIIGIGLALLMSALDDGSGWGQFFGVLVVFTVVQTLEGYIITPKIVGEKVGLSPLMVIIVLLVGGELFGFLGILLAIPAAAVLRVFMLEAIAEYKRSRLFLGESAYLSLLAEGSGHAGRDVREAVRQSVEAQLDLELPEPMTTQELQRARMRRTIKALDDARAEASPDESPATPPPPASPISTSQEPPSEPDEPSQDDEAR